MAFARPGATPSSPTGLVLNIYTGAFLDSYRQTSVFYNNPLVPVDNDPFPTGTMVHEGFFRAEGDRPQEFTPGDTPVGEQSGGAIFRITKDPYLVKSHDVAEDTRDDDTYIAREAARWAAEDRRMIHNEYDRRIAILACQAARTAALNDAVNGRVVHRGGTRVTRSGASIEAAYPRSTVGAGNIIDDLDNLAYQLDNKGIPRSLGSRVIVLNNYLYRVLTFDVGRASLFSKDYTITGNDGQQRKVAYLSGFTILNDAMPETSVILGRSQDPNNGVLPDISITDPRAKYTFNGTRQATVGMPVAIGFCRGANGQAAISTSVIRDETFYENDTRSAVEHVGMRSRIATGIKDPSCAFALEVVL